MSDVAGNTTAAPLRWDMQFKADGQENAEPRTPDSGGLTATDTSPIAVLDDWQELLARL